MREGEERCWTTEIERVDNVDARMKERERRYCQREREIERRDCQCVRGRKRIDCQCKTERERGTTTYACDT